VTEELADHARRGPALHVAAVALRGDDLLLVRHGPGAAGEWSLPGGPLELGETFAEAVVRHTGAQTGLEDALCGPFLGWSELIDDEDRAAHRVVMHFTAVVMDAGPDASGTAPAAATEVRWTPVWTVPELRLTDGLAEFLADQEIIDTVV
jgi:8-oxo-dGTP diphosphatase